MVAGATGAAAISGLTGPDPFVFNQPGAQLALSIGCLLGRAASQPLGDDGDELDMSFEAMKLALRDFLPRMKPPVNVTLTCYNTHVSLAASTHLCHTHT